MAECHSCGCFVTPQDSVIRFNEEYVGRTAGHWMMRVFARSYSRGRAGKGASVGYSTDKKHYRKTRMRLCHDCIDVLNKQAARQEKIDGIKSSIKLLIFMAIIGYFAYNIVTSEATAKKEQWKAIAEESRQVVPEEIVEEPVPPVKPVKDDLDYVVDEIMKRNYIPPENKADILKEFKEPEQKNQFFNQSDIDAIKELFTF